MYNPQPNEKETVDLLSRINELLVQISISPDVPSILAHEAVYLREQLAAIMNRIEIPRDRD